MISDRMAAVLALLDGDPDRDANLPQAVAVQAAAALGTDGICAGLGIAPSGVVLVWGREAVGVELEEVQFTLGQGPGLDAAAAGVPVLVPDLLEAGARWPAFTPAAAELKVRAIFAFPLRIGAISVGALMAHRSTVGPLADGQFADALALADAITLLLLNHASPEPAAAALEWNQPRLGWAQPPTYRAEVHQATGMISAQLGVSLAEALVRLRAYAYAEDRLIAEVAADVVARRLRFEDPSR
ncbi:MAG TPA: ANTAR domain-containing protein [Actinocrinis sp.]|uniref:ANTAR domain-containing protein n=1 Tax=Actinocrinis sp. TaxID=1920516 RepID=UPI002DDD7C23|nr:ANTAR domain-containing protein [Actinocrinis sp.]HEV3173832.1 ANTAR domain-containing protein [Actinocrinis sp.]